MFKLYSNGLSRIMSICVNYTHVRYIRYVVRNERNLYILSCQADTDCQQKRYRQSKMKSFLLNFLFVDGFRFKKKYCVVLILFHVDVTFNIRYIYREYIHKWKQLHIIYVILSPSTPSPIPPESSTDIKRTRRPAYPQVLACWQAVKLLKQHHPRAVMIHDMTCHEIMLYDSNVMTAWHGFRPRPLSPQTVGRRHSANHCSLTKSMLWRQSPRHGRNTWTTSSWRRHLSWEGGQSGDGLTPHMTVADVMPT